MAENTNNQVTITDIKMPFWSMVRFIIKATIASIPAFIILSILFLMIKVAFGMIFGGFPPV